MTYTFDDIEHNLSPTAVKVICLMLVGGLFTYYLTF